MLVVGLRNYSRQWLFISEAKRLCFLLTVTLNQALEVNGDLNITQTAHKLSIELSYWSFEEALTHNLLYVTRDIDPLLIPSEEFSCSAAARTARVKTERYYEKEVYVTQTLCLLVSLSSTTVPLGPCFALCTHMLLYWEKTSINTQHQTECW